MRPCRAPATPRARRGGFGASREAAFVPRMIDLREERDERSRRAVELILDCSARLARARRPSRPFLDRFPHRRRRQADVFRIRDLSRRDHLRLSELPALAPRGDSRPGTRESDERRLRASAYNRGSMRSFREDRGKSRRSVRAIESPSVAIRPLHGFCNRVSVGFPGVHVCPCCSQIVIALGGNRGRRANIGAAHAPAGTPP